jgi:hypothetical protein
MKPSNINEEILDTRIFNPKLPYLLTITRAAKEIGITPWAMRTRIWRGEIPVVRFDGERKQYIDRRDLEKLIQRNKTVWD